jgi:hypothetical protein
VLSVANGNSITYGAALAFYRASAELVARNQLVASPSG